MNKIAFGEIARRITGITTPVFGLTWNPPASERDTVRRLVNFLEDRRVLYNPYHFEVSPHVIQSILEIRRELTRALQELGEQSGAAPSVRAMRAACRKFLDQTEGDDGRGRGRFFDESRTLLALGELRGIFGIHIAQLCVKYGIDIESELSTILPDDTDEEDGHPDSYSLRSGMR